MHLVRMQNDDIAGLAVAYQPAIPERLDALQRQAERVGVVAVRLERVAAKMRLDPLDAAGGRRNLDTVGGDRHARTFKIAAALCG